MVVENHKLPRVQFRLSLDNMPYAEGDKKGSYITSASEAEPPKHQRML
jgi:hypothetical protein